MGTNVLKVKQSQLRDIENQILQDMHASSLSLTNQHEAFRIRLAMDTIVGYKSGKIVCTGPEAAAAVRTALVKISPPSDSKTLTIGSDETGKGEWLGPLVVAAVALTSSQSVELQSFGVADSKGIAPTRIAQLSQDIELNCRARKTVLVPPKRFNTMFDELHEEGKSLNDLLAWAHAKAISEVHSVLKPAERSELRIVIDEFSRKKTNERLGRVLDLGKVEVIQRPRAEDEIAVAAASILAREARERWIDSTSSKLDVDLRELSWLEVDRRDDRFEIAKVSYLETMKSKK
jgi:ribonuclease HIII